MTDSVKNDTKEQLLALYDKRQSIHQSINDIKSRLNALPSKFTDNEGYPLADIDFDTIRQVKTLERQLQSFLKDIESIEKDIEHLLPLVFPSTPTLESSTFLQSHVKKLFPIAKITEIQLWSPIHNAGILKDDFLISFETLNSSTFQLKEGNKDVQLVEALKQEIESSDTKIFNVCIQRNGSLITKQVNLQLSKSLGMRLTCLL